MGCTSDNRRAGSYFILGRAIGIIMIGLFFILLGSAVQGYLLYFILIFAVLSIALGLVMLYEAVTERDLGILERITFKVNKKKANKNYRKMKMHNYDKNCKGKNNQISGKSVSIKKKKDFFILGIARGATPCLKIIVLVPLLIVSGLAFSFVLLIVFAISSSVYPIIGFLGTSLLDGFNKYSRHLKVIGAILIIVLGFYVPANHIWNLGGKI